MDWSHAVTLVVGGGLTMLGGWIAHRSAATRDEANREAQRELDEARRKWERDRDRQARRAERKEQDRRERARVYASYLGVLRMANWAEAQSWLHGYKAEVEHLLTELHLQRSWVDVIGSDEVRYANRLVSAALAQYHRAAERLMDRAQAAEEVEPGRGKEEVTPDMFMAEWDEVMVGPVDRLAEAMRADIQAPLIEVDPADLPFTG